MLGVILNEQEIVDNAINQGVIDKKPMVTIGLLIKYYYGQGMNKDQIHIQVLEFMKKYYKDFKITKWYDKIGQSVSRFIKNNKKYKTSLSLKSIDSIEITEGELDTIKALEDIKLEKIAFIMLVYAKINNILLERTDGWINQTCATICKEARLTFSKGEKKEMLFNQLYNLQYIKLHKNNSKTGMKIEYINEDSPVQLTITDFENVIYQYLIHKGEKYKKCEGEDCNKYIKIKNNRTKYCICCKKKILQEQKNEWKRDKWVKEEK